MMTILLNKISRFGKFVVQAPLLVVLAAVLLLIGTASGKAAEPKALQPQKAAPATTAPATVLTGTIPVTDIATQATEVANLIRKFNTQLAPDPQIETIRIQLPEISKNVTSDLSEIRRQLRSQPTLSMLQAGQVLWEKRQRELTGWLHLLTRRATELQKGLSDLSELEKRWAQTGEMAKASKAPGPILQEIDAVLTMIREVQTPMETQRAEILDLQSRVSQEVAICGTALAEIGKAQQKAMGGILKRENPPVWSPDLWVQGSTEGPARIREIVASQRSDFEQYVHDASKGMPLHVGLFLFVAIVLCGMRRQVRRWEASDRDSSQDMTVLERPFSAALVITLFLATSPNLAITPATVLQLYSILELVPLIRLTRPMVHPRVARGLYALGVLFAFNAVREAFAGAPLIEQVAILVEVIAGMSVLGWALAFGSLRRPIGEAKPMEGLTGLRPVLGLILLIFAACLVAGALGYMRLARILTTTVLGGGVLALALFAYVRLVLGGVAFALHVWPLRLLRSVQHHRMLLERKASRLMVWAAIAVWLMRVLDYVGLFEPAVSFGKAILAAKLERGAISISVEDVLAFLLTVWVSYLLSRFIRFVLEEDIYPRIRIQRGLSYAISSLLNYVILALGFVVAIGLLGVDLGKVTVLAGAFGVGIGFGLQSIVNNFVSGLILLFERPIHVGDSVEMGSLQGQVKRIGIRSSVVRTGHGAEIIVPNSHLVSEQVTNWTLSDQLRRIDLPAGVNYGADPKKVIELMEAVARAHPHVLNQPAPRAFFTGFGDSSVNFELRAWTDQFGNWFQIRSELAAALYGAVYEAGMSFPFPQREVRVLGDADTGKNSAALKGEKA